SVSSSPSRRLAAALSSPFDSSQEASCVSFFFAVEAVVELYASRICFATYARRDSERSSRTLRALRTWQPKGTETDRLSCAPPRPAPDPTAEREVRATTSGLVLGAILPGHDGVF